jgi:hypothetical protein
MAFAPPPPTWYGQIAPRHNRFPRVFTGRIVALSLGRLPIIENDTLAGVDDLRRQLRDGAPLSATVSGVQSSPGIAPIIIVASLPGDVISWAVDGNDAVFTAAVRGHFIGLRQPSVRIADVVPSTAADTLTLTGAYSGGRYRLRAESAATVRTRTVAASASFGWAFAMPLPRYAFGAEVHALTALWLAIIWAMLGFWARRGRSRARPNHAILGLSIIVLVMGLAVIPRLLGIPASHWTEWLASAGGFMIAWSGAARMG